MSTNDPNSNILIVILLGMILAPAVVQLIVYLSVGDNYASQQLKKHSD